MMKPPVCPRPNALLSGSVSGADGHTNVLILVFPAVYITRGGDDRGSKQGGIRGVVQPPVGGAQRGFNHLVQVLLLDVRQQSNKEGVKGPRPLGVARAADERVRRANKPGGEPAVGALVIVQRQADLLEVVGAGHA